MDTDGASDFRSFAARNAVYRQRRRARRIARAWSLNRRLRAPCLKAFIAVRAFPAAVRGPVERVHGRQLRISMDWRARRSADQPDRFCRRRGRARKAVVLSRILANSITLIVKFLRARGGLMRLGAVGPLRGPDLRLAERARLHSGHAALRLGLERKPHVKLERIAIPAERFRSLLHALGEDDIERASLA